MALVFQSLPNTYSITNAPIGYVEGVYASGGTIYAATQGSGVAGGLSISTDGGSTFTNYGIANGLGDPMANDVYESGGTIYVATYHGLSISTDGGASFTNYTTANGLGSNEVFGVYEPWVAA